MFAHQNNEPEPETIRTFPVHVFDKLTAGKTNWSPKNPLGTKLYRQNGANIIWLLFVQCGPHVG
jgi:hypothetical protein